MAMPAFLRRPEIEESAPPPPPAARLAANNYTLRSLPHETLFFYCKRIDNTRLVREPDPGAQRVCWSSVVAACVLLMALTGILAPSVAGRLAGYRLEALKQEEHRLFDERRVLELEEARLLNPARLEELAHRHNLVTPSPGQVTHLDGKNDSSLAMAK